MSESKHFLNKWNQKLECLGALIKQNMFYKITVVTETKCRWRDGLGDITNIKGHQWYKFESHNMSGSVKLLEVRGIEVTWFAYIRLILEGKFGNDLKVTPGD